MTARQLVGRLRALGVRLRAEDGKLKYKAPHGVLGADLLAEVHAAKAEIITILHRAEQALHVTHYATMRDGVRLAAEVFRPKRDGVPVAEPLPAVWRHERSDRPAGADGTLLDDQPWLLGLLAGGYVVVSVDARGTGGSTGDRAEAFGPQEAADCYDVTEWMAAQPFCDGAVGMFGDPCPGFARLWAAGAAAPSLRAAVAVGPWADPDHPGPDLAAEHLSWFAGRLTGDRPAEPAVRCLTDGAVPAALVAAR